MELHKEPTLLHLQDQHLVRLTVVGVVVQAAPVLVHALVVLAPVREVGVNHEHK